MSDQPAMLNGDKMTNKIARQIERCNRMIAHASERNAFDDIEAKNSIRFHKAASDFEMMVGHIPTDDELRRQD